MMIISPLGIIRVFADGACLEYHEISHGYDRPPVKEHPIAGCYRIHVPVGEHRSIRCELELSDPTIFRTGDSGQAYLNAEFEKGTINLCIGAVDENPAFETVRTTCGVEYIIHKQIPEVVFGIAWVTDHEGSYDARTWYAADPTLDKNRSFLLVRKSQSDSTSASAFVNAIFIICFLMTRQSDVSFGA